MEGTAETNHCSAPEDVTEGMELESGEDESTISSPEEEENEADFLETESLKDETSELEEGEIVRSCGSKAGGGASTILSTDTNYGNGTPPFTTTTNNIEDDYP